MVILMLRLAVTHSYRNRGCARVLITEVLKVMNHDAYMKLKNSVVE